MIDLKGLKGFSAWKVYNKIAFNLIFIRKFNVDNTEFLLKLSSLNDIKSEKEIKKILPDLVNLGKRIHKTDLYCIEKFKEEKKSGRSKMIIEALTFTSLDDEEILRLLSVHKDKNEISYNKSNIENLDVGEIFNLILETLIECSFLNCDLSLLNKENNDEIKKHRIDINSEVSKILENNSSLSVEELISIAIKKNVG